MSLLLRCGTTSAGAGPCQAERQLCALLGTSIQLPEAEFSLGIPWQKQSGQLGLQPVGSLSDTLQGKLDWLAERVSSGLPAQTPHRTQLGLQKEAVSSSGN